jgi:hypothetical protein
MWELYYTDVLDGTIIKSMNNYDPRGLAWKVGQDLCNYWNDRMREERRPRVYELRKVPEIEP